MAKELSNKELKELCAKLGSALTVAVKTGDSLYTQRHCPFCESKTYCVLPCPRIVLLDWKTMEQV